MHDFSISILVADFFRQDPFRALGVMGFACVVLSMTADFELLRLLGFVHVSEEQGRESSVA